MKLLRWTPAIVLSLGCLLSAGVVPQRSMPLRAPLESAVPNVLASYVGADHKLGDEERDVAGVTAYLLRSYQGQSPAEHYSVYVGYHDRQGRGLEIHSPKNCLPGGGWEALSSRTARISTESGPITVNRYLIHRKGQQALVLYWYQGRGRVEANEYRVKVDLLRDAALLSRSEEAIVRIVVPINSSEDEAFLLASNVATELVPALATALPN